MVHPHTYTFADKFKFRISPLYFNTSNNVEDANAFPFLQSLVIIKGSPKNKLELRSVYENDCFFLQE